ncbi:MAG: hypothetical protein R6U89_11195 [Dehalococcoidia bacterium]
MIAVSIVIGVFSFGVLAILAGSKLLFGEREAKNMARSIIESSKTFKERELNAVIDKLSGSSDAEAQHLLEVLEQKKGWKGTSQ